KTTGHVYNAQSVLYDLRLRSSFFFSSRRRHTRSKRDWSSDVCSSDLTSDGPTKCFGFIQAYDTKPKRRLFEVLRSQGMQMNQQVTFLTDGGEDVRDLPLYLNPQAEHYLDWFQVTMRITLMNQLPKSLRSRDHPDLAT